MQFRRHIGKKVSLIMSCEGKTLTVKSGIMFVRIQFAQVSRMIGISGRSPARCLTSSLEMIEFEEIVRRS